MNIIQESSPVDDTLFQVLWTRYFCKQQRYELQEPTINQDDRSLILLVNNNETSGSKQILTSYQHVLSLQTKM